MASQLVRSLERICVRLAPTAHGVGVVTIKPVPAGTKVCTCFAEMTRVGKDEIAHLDPAVRRLFTDICDSPSKGEYCFVPSNYDQHLSIAMFLNHSKEPTAQLKDYDVVTLRDLGAGEEVTVDYRDYLSGDSTLHAWATKLSE